VHQIKSHELDIFWNTPNVWLLRSTNMEWM